MWTDTNGRTLTDYPRPSVAVDVAVLTYSEERLHVLVVPGEDGWALPGTFLHEEELLKDAADRALRTKAHLTGIGFRQLQVFDALGRDMRGWVLSVGHTVALPVGRLPDGAELAEVSGTAVTRPLLYDHALIAERAVEDLRAQYGQTVDPSGLCGTEFTVLELRRLYEAVFGHPLPKDSFRRHVKDCLVETGRTNQDAVGKPAAVMRLKASTPALPPAARAFLVSGGRGVHRED